MCGSPENLLEHDCEDNLPATLDKGPPLPSVAQPRASRHLGDQGQLLSRDPKSPGKGDAPTEQQQQLKTTGGDKNKPGAQWAP